MVKPPPPLPPKAGKKSSKKSKKKEKAPTPSAKVPAELHRALAILEADPAQWQAALLLVRFLVVEDKPYLAAKPAARLVRVFTRRGDLPRAVLAAHAAHAAHEQDEQAGETDLYATIAEAFGEDSPRLSDSPASPPPLPVADIDSKQISKLKKSAFIERAESALQDVLLFEDDMDDDLGLPRLPLFSDLEPIALTDLLRAFTVRDIDAQSELITEGEEGTEAFLLADGMLEVSRGRGDDKMVLAALGPGSLFGEMALVSDAPRAASVGARERSLVLCVSRADLEKLARVTPEIGLRLSQFCRGRMLSNLMHHSELLRAVPASDRANLINKFETCHFESGQSLVELGSEGEALFLIASGEVAVDGRDADDERVRIAELGPGEVVGEISLVLRRPANATVYALHPTVALKLTRQEFQAAIAQYPALLGELYETATGREEETRSLVAQETLNAGEVILL